MPSTEEDRMYGGASGLERASPADDGATDDPPAGEVWSRVKRRLRAELGEDVFASWFARLELDVVTGGCARLTVPTRFLKSWIEAHYADRVLATYRAEAPRVERISVGVRGTPVRDDRKPQDASRPAPAKALAAMAPFGPRPSAAPPVSSEQRGEAADLAGAPLDARLTFQSFMIGRSNALAHAAADRVARHEGGPALYNPLYLHAGVGLGKSHLLHAIGHEARGAGRRVIYLTADRFMYGFVASLKAQTSLAFKERLRAIDLLIIDDVQFIQGRSIQAEFGHTINALIDAGRQIIVAADRPPAALEALGDGVRCRPAGGAVRCGRAGGLVGEIGALDEPLRASILAARLAAVRAAHPTFEVGPAVV